MQATLHVHANASRYVLLCLKVSGILCRIKRYVYILYNVLDDELTQSLYRIGAQILRSLYLMA